MLKLKTKEISQKKQSLLALSSYKSFIKIEDAKKILGLSRVQATKTLSKLEKQGWLKRIAQGLYVPVPMEINNDEPILDDPWLAIPELFAEYYIGGLSAVSYWRLTEQTFKNSFVFTTKQRKSNTLFIEGHKFIIKTIKKDKMFGYKQVWRSGDGCQICISDVYKTLIDMLDDPRVGGGIQHTSHCLNRFIELSLRRERRARLELIKEKSKNTKTGRRKNDFEKLILYAKKMNNGSVFKRLGFLLEQKNFQTNEPPPQIKHLITECKQHLTAGYAKLDPSMKCNKLISKWQLWIPNFWLKEDL